MTAIVVIGDLHLGAGPGTRTEDFEADEALVACLDEVAAQRPDRLVLLGDTFDFTRVELTGGRGRRRLDTSAEAALRKLDRIAAGHPGVVEALRRIGRAGTRLDVLPGNHDLELLRPAVQAGVARLLDGAKVTFHPWFLLVPGLLYAEHGSQYHDLNRLPALLDVVEGGDRPLPVPLGALAPDVFLAVRDEPATALAAAARGVFRLAADGASARRTRAAYEQRLHRAAPAFGLPGATLVAIDRAGRHGTVAAARRIVRVAARRVSRPDAYMLTAADRVAAALRAGGAAPAFTVFGHTHFGADVTLPGGARYLNAGTWSRLRAPDAEAGFVRIEAGAAAPSAAFTAVR